MLLELGKWAERVEAFNSIWLTRVQKSNQLKFISTHKSSSFERFLKWVMLSICWLQKMKNNDDKLKSRWKMSRLLFRCTKRSFIHIFRIDLNVIYWTLNEIFLNINSTEFWNTLVNSFQFQINSIHHLTWVVQFCMRQIYWFHSCIRRWKQCDKRHIYLR